MANELTLSSASLETFQGQLTTHTGLETPTGVIDTLAIGQRLDLVLNYDYDSMADGVRLYFNPWLFDVSCDFSTKYVSGAIDSPPDQSWFLEIAGQPTATDINGTMDGAGVAANSQKNLVPKFQYTTGPSGGFTVKLPFIMTADLEDIITDQILENHDRLLKSTVLDSTELQNVIQSIYNTNKAICTLVYLIDPNNQELDPVGSGTLIDIERFDTHSIPATSRFYEEGLVGGAPEMTDPTFSFTRGGNVVTDLSILEDTSISFNATYTGGTPTGATVYLIRTDTTDNLDTFITNYDMSVVWSLVDVPAPGVLANHIKSPSTGITALGGDKYGITFQVDRDLETIGTYRVIVVYYESDPTPADQVVNSWISDELTVTTKPTICLSPSSTSFIEDLTTGAQVIDVAEVYPQDRIRVSGQINFNDVISQVQDYYLRWGLTPPANAADNITAATVHIFEKLDDTPSTGTALISSLDLKVATRPGGLIQWSPRPPQQLGHIDVSESTPGIIDYEYTFRVRYEDDKDPISVSTAPMTNQLQLTTVGGQKAQFIEDFNLNQDWRGKDIFINWTFIMNFADAPEPFSMNFFRTKKLDVQEYDDTHATPDLSGIRILHPTSLVELSVVDSEELDEVLVEVTRISTVGDRDMIAYLDPPIIGVASLQEHEVWVPTLDQIQSLSLTDVDEEWVDTQDKAFFKVPVSELDDAIYRISASIKN